MDSIIFRALLPLVVLLLALSAACGGDDDDDIEDGDARITVTTTADVSERDDEISLREAIELATGALLAPDLTEEELDHLSGDPGRDSADIIVFDLDEGAVIELTEALPPLSRGDDVIDGEGAVTIDGSAAEFVCLEINSGRNTVSGLTFDSCRTAIEVTGQGFENNIGAPGNGNVIVGGVVGIEIAGRDNVVKGNHIGVEPGGAEARGNEFEGVWVSRSGRANIIGGPGQGEGNIISGNPLFGISVDGAHHTVVQGNYIGLDTSGRQAVPNHTGIRISNGAFDTLIGGLNQGEGNVIAANRLGVRLTGENTTGNRIIGNIFSKSAGQGEGIPNDQDVYEDIGVGENEVANNILR